MRFLALRAAVPAAIIAIIFLFIRGLGVLALPGIFLGIAASLYKIRMFGLFLRGFAGGDSIGRKPVIFQIFSQLIVFALLTVAVIADLRLFIGVATGLILVPLVICVNAITEKIGVTHNCWGEKEEAVDWKK